MKTLNSLFVISKRFCSKKKKPHVPMKQKLNSNNDDSNLLDSNNLVWIDCEMTGLDFTKQKICEIACIVTDKDLNIIKDGPSIVIHHDKIILDNMSVWCKENFRNSGLTKEIINSKINTKKAEEMILDFIKQYCPKQCILCGNSIHADKKFIDNEMKDLSYVCVYVNI